MTLQEEYPLTTKFWAELTPVQRVVLVTLHDVRTEIERLRDILEFAENISKDNSIGLLRRDHLDKLEELLQSGSKDLREVVLVNALAIVVNLRWKR